jgi:hypothetical protein
LADEAQKRGLVESISPSPGQPVIRRGSFTSVEDLRNKLLAFLEYFNAVFAKPFKWTYNGRPLQP